MASRPNWKLPLILAATLFVVGTFVYWNEFTRRPKVEEQEEAQKKVFAIKDQSIASLKVPGFEFKCLDLDKKLCKVGDNSRWEMVAPIAFKADDSSVNGFLSSLNNVQPVETIDLSQDPAEKRPALLAQYKLDEESRKTARKVEMTIDGKVKTAYFGETHPIHEGLFVALSDNPDKVFVTPSYFTMNLEKDLSYWRDKRILSVNATDVVGFRVIGSKGSTWVKRKDGKWELEGGLAGDIENVDAFVTAITYLTAKAFPEKKVIQGAKPALTTFLELANKTTVTVTFYNKGYKSPTELGTLYVTSTLRDQVYEIDASTLNRLDKSAADFRLAKLITSLDRYGAKRIEAGGVVLEMKNSKWLDSSGKEANNQRVQTFLDKLSGNRIQEFLSGMKIPPGEKDGLVIRLATEGGEHKRELVFWKAGDRLFARDRLSGRKDEAYRIDSTVSDTLPWDKSWFFTAPSPLPAPAGHGH